jgi:hypothetical protein
MQLIPAQLFVAHCSRCRSPAAHLVGSTLRGCGRRTQSNTLQCSCAASSRPPTTVLQLTAVAATHGATPDPMVPRRSRCRSCTHCTLMPGTPRITTPTRQGPPNLAVHQPGVYTQGTSAALQPRAATEQDRHSAAGPGSAAQSDSDAKRSTPWLSLRTGLGPP